MSAGRFDGALSRPSGLWFRACDVVSVGGDLVRVVGPSVLHRVLSWSWAVGPDAERRETRAGDARFEKMGPFRLIGSFTYPMEAMTPCMGAPCGANCVECATGAQ